MIISQMVSLFFLYFSSDPTANDETEPTSNASKTGASVNIKQKKGDSSTKTEQNGASNGVTQGDPEDSVEAIVCKVDEMEDGE